VCRNCGTNYSEAVPPTNDWKCDICGGEVVQRDDDTEIAIHRRLALYEQETAPLIDYYRGLGTLVEVDGEGSIEGVFKRLTEAIDARREPSKT